MIFLTVILLKDYSKIEAGNNNNKKKRFYLNEFIQY